MCGNTEDFEQDNNEATVELVSEADWDAFSEEPVPVVSEAEWDDTVERIVAKLSEENSPVILIDTPEVPWVYARVETDDGPEVQVFYNLTAFISGGLQQNDVNSLLAMLSGDSDAAAANAAVTRFLAEAAMTASGFSKYAETRV